MDFLRKIALILFIPFLAGFVSESYARDDFEGHISFVKKTQYDTVHIHYFVKDNKVRINQYTDDGHLIKSLLADLEKDSIIAIDPSRKMYKPLNQKTESNLNKNKNELKIQKTKNHKIINGVKCYQWRIKDRNSNSEVAYWVADENFDFIDELVQLLKNKDRLCHYFSHFQDKSGSIPFVAVERTLVRKEKQRVVLSQIKEKKIDDSYFNIPSTYAEVRY
ncbi:MAG: DUF4412 domain-containing protein [Bacteroidales bacterium]